MNESSQQEYQVRQFLLGQLEDHERQWFEEELMTSTAYQEEVLIIEEGLIEDYLDGVLPADEQQAFETNFLASLKQRRRVQIARLLGAYGASKLSESDQPQPASAPSRRWSIARGIRNNPVVFTSLAVILLVVIAAVILQGIWSWRENKQRLEATRQRSIIEHELAQLNSTQNVTASTIPLVLVPVTTRDAKEASTLSIPLPAEIVEAQLILTGTTYSRYTVELSRSGTVERFKINELHSQYTANGLAVIVRLPSRLLGRGDYNLSLVGVSDDGNQAKAGEYHFQVGS